MTRVLGLILTALSRMFTFKRDSKARQRVKEDQDFADAIRKGDGKSVAKKWKLRKHY